MSWVSKAERGAAERVVAFLNTRVNELTAENRRLTDIIVELKREGFHPPAPPGEAPPPETPLDEGVELALREVAPPGTSTEREMIRWARRQSEAGADPAKLAAAIRNGGDVPDDPDEELDNL